MIVADLGRALALGSIAVALWLDRLTFAQILIAPTVEGRPSSSSSSASGPLCATSCPSSS
jgi:hypothetical protein